MSDERRDDRQTERYVPPHELGLDPAHHDKFVMSGYDPFIIIDKSGKRVRVVTDADGNPKRVPE